MDSIFGLFQYILKKIIIMCELTSRYLIPLHFSYISSEINQFYDRYINQYEELSLIESNSIQIILAYNIFVMLRSRLLMNLVKRNKSWRAIFLEKSSIPKYFFRLSMQLNDIIFFVKNVWWLSNWFNWTCPKSKLSFSRIRPPTFIQF